MTECTRNDTKLCKKDYKTHKIEELIKRLSIFGRPVVTRIRNCDCQITYLAILKNGTGFMNLWSTLKGSEGSTAKQAVENILSVIERELWIACDKN